MNVRTGTALGWALAGLALILGLWFVMSDADTRKWEMGEPIVTYWAGPPLTDATATQMAEGGWNLVWAREGALDIAQRHGLRAQLNDPLLRPASLDDETSRASLQSLIERVKDHPALYAYHLDDEPSIAQMHDLGRLVAFIRERDPEHAVYINLYPTYAKNAQLGVTGDAVSAYREYLHHFVETVHPDLLSYDHYNFMKRGDRDQYFLNLALVREAALGAGLPYMNIVQASAWRPSWRVPTEDELRWLANTSLAYGTQGISYYVYGFQSKRKYAGGMIDDDGVPTANFHAARGLNPEFVAIAKQLKGMRSVGAYHAGTVPVGTVALPQDVSIGPEVAVPTVPAKRHQKVQGWLLGYFDASADASVTDASHVLVVNLDYQLARTIKLVADRALATFDAPSGRWQAIDAPHLDLSLPPGGAQLLRIEP